MVYKTSILISQEHLGVTNAKFNLVAILGGQGRDFWRLQMNASSTWQHLKQEQQNADQRREQALKY